MRDSVFILITLAALAFALTRVSRKTWDGIRARIGAAGARIKAMAEYTQAQIATKIMRRRMAYRALFLGDDGKITPAGRIVLADISRFGRGLTSLAQVSPVSRQVDPLATMLSLGRHEILLRILKEVNADHGDLFAIVKEEESHG